MTEQTTGSQRPWQDIAKELEQEQDVKRMIELANELAAAMDAQTNVGKLRQNVEVERPKS
jgi:hypothetical protein